MIQTPLSSMLIQEIVLNVNQGDMKKEIKMRKSCPKTTIHIIDYTLHTIIDNDSDLIRRIRTTTANLHDNLMIYQKIVMLFVRRAGICEESVKDTSYIQEEER